MDRLSALTVFRRVAELSGFSAAARDLGLSNAAVSKMIRDLEADLGAALIIRTTRSLRLTDVGANYFQRICTLLDGLSDADESVRSSTGTPRGTLKVTAPVSLSAELLNDLLPGFALQYPDISIDLDLSDRQADLMEGQFDVAIRGGVLPDSSLRARKLMTLDRVLCASPAYLETHGSPETPDELAAHNCLIYAVPLSPDRWHLSTLHGERAEVSVSGNYRANSSLALKAAAISGLGIELTPRLYDARQIADGTLAPVLPDWQDRDKAVHAVYPGHAESSLKLRLFIDFLAHALKEQDRAVG
jgi:DNA-binding transcriptional LysR family regulator